VKIGIDPGHGGKDPGAVGRILGTKEKDITLEIGLRLDRLLRGAGHQTYLSRNSDVFVSLQARANFFNAQSLDLVVSIHLNSAINFSANYISTFILGRGDKAERFAEAILRELVKTLRWPDGGVREANFYILRQTKAPAVLTEIGFISNQQQERLLTNEEAVRQLIASAILTGIDPSVAKKDQPPNKVFKDIAGHWARKAIEKVHNYGIVTGYDDNTFRPDNPLTRAEFATAISRLMDKLGL